MSALDALRYRVSVLRRALLDRRGWREEMDEELRHHLELEEMHQRHAGASPDEARQLARRRFGDPRRVRERVADGSGVDTVDALRQDVRFAVRTLRVNPGFTLAAVLTLAVGIGATTAIFSAVHAMLLRPLPFAEPARLMQVSLTAPASQHGPARDDVIWSYPKFAAFRDAQRLFTDLALYTSMPFTTRGTDGAERATGEYVGGRYLSTLGLRPVLGRDFTADEDRHPGGPRVAIVGHAFWQRRYDARASAIGQALDLDGQPYTVVGVLPPGFRGLTGQADFLVPLLAQPADEVNQAWSHSYELVARLRPGVTTGDAERAVRLLGPRVDAAWPHPEVASEHWGAAARPLDVTRVDPVVRRSLLVLLGATGLVLLIACANVANLLLVRAGGRRREIAVRLAIGAGRGRLVRQLLTESVLLALLGGAASVAVAWWGVRLLSLLEPAQALRSQRLGGLGAVSFDSIQLDLTALAFAAGLAVATGLLFGLLPALQATRPALTAELKDDGGGTAGGPLARVRGRSALAALEVALALVLLAGSGLMLRSLGNLLAVHPGFEARGVLTVRLNRPVAWGRDSLPAFYDALLERAGALPGATGAAITDCPPLNGGCNGTVIRFRDRPEPPKGQEPLVGVHWVSPNWFGVAGVPLLRGRHFTAADRAGAQKVVLVNAAAARAFWPGQDAVGRPVSVGQGGFWDDTAQVVGVVGDVRYGTIDSVPRPEVYLSYAQSPGAPTMLFVRTAGDPLGAAEAARRAVHAVAPDAPVYDVQTLEARVAGATAYARFGTALLTLFGAVALALATMGTYGVVAFAVAQRRREIGVRVALGATPGRVVRFVVGQGLRIAAAGATLGVVAALAATRVLRTQLYDVAPTDPLTFAAIVALLVAAVLVASWAPAVRAAAVPPGEVLR